MQTGQTTPPRKRQRGRAQIVHDRAELTQRYVRGQSQYQIAAALGITQQQVSDDLKVVQEEWRKSAIRDFDEHKAWELAKLDAVERECWEAWEKSKETLEHVHQEQTTEEIQVRAGHAGQKRAPATRTRKKVIKRTEQQGGNSAFLYAIQRCVETRCKILGLLAPTDINVTGQISFGDLWSLAQQDKPDIRVLSPVEDEAG